MVLKKRIELQARFRNGLRPSEDDFAEVIGSALNMRDDQFFGRWRPGVLYRKGDVVIHNRTLWELQTDQDLCAQTPPEHGPDWKSLVIPTSDEDWILVSDPDDPEAPVVMFANDTVDCVGIGTYHPRALLDVFEAGRSRFLVGPKAATCTTLTLVHLKTGEEKTYLVTGLDADYATWLSDAPGGFVFRHGAPSDDDAQDRLGCHDGDLLMVVQPDTGGLVRVGIGTDKPDGMLDVTDRGKGQFLFNPEDKQDPVFTIVNLGPEAVQNYLASGVGAEKAVFVTDAPDGFVFKQGGEYEAFGNEENINQGQTLLGLAPGGKLGVGMEPEAYQLDVNGLVRAHAFYVNTDRNNVARPAGLGDLLGGVMRLRPVRFDWRVATGFADEGEQFGLIAQEVEEVFPQLVKTNTDGTKAVAYPNLVAVVVRAVQEQQALAERQQEEIDEQQALSRRQQQQLDNQQARLDNQQQQLDAQQQVNQEQQQQLDAQQQQLAEQQQQLDAQQGQIDAQQDALEGQGQRLEDHQARIEALEQRLDDQQATNNQQQQQIEEQQRVNEAQQRQLDEQQALNARQQRQLEEQQRRIEQLQRQVEDILRRLGGR